MVEIKHKLIIIEVKFLEMNNFIKLGAFACSRATRNEWTTTKCVSNDRRLWYFRHIVENMFLIVWSEREY